jgi:ABC-type glycerol-3-phosphate transport system substrate-binding protein
MRLSAQPFGKKTLVLGIILLVLLTGGFGCKGASTAQQVATKPVTLEYWTVFDDVDALQALITKFHAAHPYITVNVRQLTQDELYPRLVEALAEDKGPDIVSISNRNLRGVYSKLAPMPSSVNDTTVLVTKGTVGTNTTITTVPKKMLSTSQLDRDYVQAVKNDVVIGDKIYGLPLSFDTMALYYNKDLLDRAGVAEPPKTWEEFQAAVKKITKYNKKTDSIIQSGAALGTSNNISVSDDLVYLLYRQSGLDFVAKNGQPVFNRVASGNINCFKTAPRTHDSSV